MRKRSVTSHDVARLAGVSRATVSLVLNQVPGATISEPTRQRVLEAAAQLDYHINAAGRSLRRQRTGMIGLVVRQPPGRLSADAFLPPVIEGITSVTGPAGLRLLIEPLDPARPVTYVSLVREGHVDGLIFGVRSNDVEIVGLHTEGVPIVLWGQIPGSGLPFVDVDNVAAARSAVEHLIVLGHRRIGCITNAHPIKTVGEAAGRLRGYRAALEAHDITVDEGLIRYGDYDERSGFVAMQSLLGQGVPPSAVFVASDEVALGALRAAREAGLRIPDELAFVGFDDIPMARYVVPALTTVRVPAREIGAGAATILASILGTGRPQRSMLLPTELVVRESSIPPQGRPEG
jgi:LacI family transcriptional regulator, galactose operon repressor